MKEKLLINLITNSVVTLVLPPTRGVVQKKEGGRGGFVQKRRTGDLGLVKAGREGKSCRSWQDQEEEGVYSGVGLGGGEGGFGGGEVEVDF